MPKEFDNDTEDVSPNLFITIDINLLEQQSNHLSISDFTQYST